MYHDRAHSGCLTERFLSCRRCGFVLGRPKLGFWWPSRVTGSLKYSPSRPDLLDAGGGCTSWQGQSLADLDRLALLAWSR